MTSVCQSYRVILLLGAAMTSSSSCMCMASAVSFMQLLHASSSWLSRVVRMGGCSPVSTASRYIRGDDCHAVKAVIPPWVHAGSDLAAPGLG